MSELGNEVFMQTINGNEEEPKLTLLSKAEIREKIKPMSKPEKVVTLFSMLKEVTEAIDSETPVFYRPNLKSTNEADLFNSCGNLLKVSRRMKDCGDLKQYDFYGQPNRMLEKFEEYQLNVRKQIYFVLGIIPFNSGKLRMDDQKLFETIKRLFFDD